MSIRQPPSSTPGTRRTTGTTTPSTTTPTTSPVPRARPAAAGTPTPSAAQPSRTAERTVGSVARAPAGTNLGESGLNPFPPELGADVLRSVQGVAATNLAGVDPLGALAGVQDGTVRMQVPLNPGRYSIAGNDVTVRPGTVASVDVQVRNGQVVPSRDRNGRDTGAGTRVSINPPLDLPAWAEGRGAYVQDRGNGRGDITVQVGGWFDQKMQERGSLALPDVVRNLTGGGQSAGAQPGGASGAGGASRPAAAQQGGGFPTQMFNLDNARFEGQVTMRDNVINAGAMRVDLAPGTQVTVSGTGREARLSGQVNIDGARLNQDGTAVDMGRGSARLDVGYRRNADGSMGVRTTVDNLQATVNGADLRARGAGGQEDRVNLGPTTVTGGRVQVDTTLAQGRDGQGAVTSSTTSVSLQAQGSIRGARMHVPDAQDGARVDVAAGRFEGRVETGPNGVRVDASLRDVAVGVEDLQTAHNGARADIHHARATGDATLRTDGNGFDLRVNARSLDVRVDDHAGRVKGTEVDLGRSTVTGSGQLRVSSAGGTEVTGALNVDVNIDDLKVRDGTGRAVVDVAQGSRIQGTVSSIRAGTDGSFDLRGRAQLDATLERVDAVLPGVHAQGGATVRGTTDVNITQDGVRFQNADARLTATVEDARINAGEVGTLDVARGAVVDLNVRELGYTSATGANIRVGEGSRITGALDEGRLSVSGNEIELRRGSNVTLDITQLRSGASGREMEGRLTVEANVGTRTSAEAIRNATGVRLDGPVTSDGTGRVTIDNVRLHENGNAVLSGVGVQLDARIGRISGSTGATAEPATGNTPATPATTTPPAVPQMPAAAAAPARSSPAGVLTAQQVQQMSAAQMAGAGAVRGRDFNPLDVARQVQNGTINVSIPVEGRVGEGWLKSADFPRGTTLDVQLQVRNGQIVRDQARATFSHAGDGPAWVSVRGAYFDPQGTMRLDLGGMRDFAVPGFENMPMRADAFVDRLKGNGSTGGTGGAPAAGNSGGGTAGLNAFRLNETRVDIRDAQFRAGRIDVPGGHVDIADGTRLSVSGTLQNATLSGRVDMNGAHVQQDGVALDTGRGSGDLRVEYRQENGRAVVRTSLQNLDVETRYAVQKRANGDYVHLGQGRLEGASFAMEGTVQLDRAGRPRGMTPGAVTLEAPRFQGTVQGARLTVPDGDGTAQVEVGPSTVDGSVSINGQRVAVRGRVENLDAAVADLQAGTGRGRVDIEHARIRGDATVEFSTENGVRVDGNVRDISVVARRILGSGGELTVDAGSTLIKGRGTLQMDSRGTLAVDGNLHVDTTLNSAGGGAAPTLAQGSRVVADVERVALGEDGALTIRGRGVVDLDVRNLDTRVGGQRITGDARVTGGGAITVDTRTGISLPGTLRVDMKVNDAQLGAGGNAVDLGGNSRADLLFTRLEVGPDGRPRQVELGAGSRVTGELDGGTLSIPGVEGNLQLLPGSSGEFVLDGMTVTENGVRRARGSLQLQAVVSADSAVLQNMGDGARLDRMADGRVRVGLSIPGVEMREDGTFTVDGATLSLNARLGTVHGRTRR